MARYVVFFLGLIALEELASSVLVENRHGVVHLDVHVIQNGLELVLLVRDDLFCS